MVVACGEAGCGQIPGGEPADCLVRMTVFDFGIIEHKDNAFWRCGWD